MWLVGQMGLYSFSWSPVCVFSSRSNYAFPSLFPNLVPVRLRVYIARCSVVQVFASRAPWIRPCFDNRSLENSLLPPLKGNQLMKCFPLDHPISPTIHTLSFRNTDSHTSSSFPLNPRTDPNPTISSSSLFQSFPTYIADDSLINSEVTCPSTITCPFFPSASFSLIWSRVAQ